MPYELRPLPAEHFLQPQELQQLLAPAIGDAAAETLYRHIREADHGLLARNALWLELAAMPQAAQPQAAQPQAAQGRGSQLREARR